MRITRTLCILSLLSVSACGAGAPGFDEPNGALEPDDATAAGDLSDEPEAPPAAGGDVGAKSADAPPTLETTFTDLRATDQDRAILDHLVRLIHDTPAGEEIRAAIHSLTANYVERALLDAHQRGVRVYVVHDGHDAHSGDASPAELAAALGADHRFCGHGGQAWGCISDDPSGIMHSKLVLFSKTRDPSGALRPWVSWFGSANMTWATGANTYNNTVTVYGDQTLYDHFDGDYFAKLWAERTYARNDFYDPGAGRGYFGSAQTHITVYASPEQDSDLVLNRLDYVDPDDGCRIRVSQATIHDARLALVRKLVALRKSGCKVWVAVGSIEDGARAALKAAHIPVHRNKIHDKFVMTYSRYAGSRGYRKIVFTGSHNWTYSANYRNDELFIKIADARVYDAFYTHFNNNYNSGDPL